MLFLEKLVEILSNAWERVAPFVIVMPWRHTVILRLGHPVRALGTGFHWKWPLADDPLDVDTAETTMRLPPQSLTTQDLRDVIVTVIVKYRIADPIKYVSAVTDQIDALADVISGETAKAIRGLTLEALLADPPERAVATAVRRRVHRYGFEIVEDGITFADLTRGKSLRLVLPVGKDLAN